MKIKLLELSEEEKKMTLYEYLKYAENGFKPLPVISDRDLMLYNSNGLYYLGYFTVELERFSGFIISKNLISKETHIPFRMPLMYKNSVKLNDATLYKMVNNVYNKQVNFYRHILKPYYDTLKDECRLKMVYTTPKFSSFKRYMEMTEDEINCLAFNTSLNEIINMRKQSFNNIQSVNKEAILHNSVYNDKVIIYPNYDGLHIFFPLGKYKKSTQCIAFKLSDNSAYIIKDNNIYNENSGKLVTDYQMAQNIKKEAFDFLEEIENIYHNCYVMML